MKYLKLVINTANYEVTIYNANLEKPVKNFCLSLVSLKMEYRKKIKRVVAVPDKEYFLRKGNTFVFPIGTLNNFLGMLGTGLGIVKDDIELIINKSNLGKDANFKFKTHFKPRDYQQEYIDELTKKDHSMLLVDLQTGKGKTFIAMNALCKIGKKVGIVILPKYIEKWIGDIQNYTYTTRDKIFIIQGDKSWRELMSMTEKELEHYDFFIFSTRTLSMFFSNYENDTYEYTMSPLEIYNRLGIGAILSDEAHEEFHVLFRALMYFPVAKIIALSATLDSNQPRQKYLYNTLFPPENRISNIIKYDKYIDIIGVPYSIDRVSKIKCQTTQGYSHIMFEQSVMRYMPLLANYKDFIFNIIKEDYIKRRKPGEKLLVFCGTISMCKFLAKQAKKEFKKIKPNLDIRTYVMEDKYEDIMEADICFSTVLSSGTAIDIPGLITVIQTTLIGSLQKNVQALGRLRKIRGREVRYYCIWCKNIDKQRTINYQRTNIIKPLAKSYTVKDDDVILKVDVKNNE